MRGHGCFLLVLISAAQEYVTAIGSRAQEKETNNDLKRIRRQEDLTEGIENAVRKIHRLRLIAKPQAEPYGAE
jgi:hypothetical protein